MRIIYLVRLPVPRETMRCIRFSDEALYLQSGCKVLDTTHTILANCSMRTLSIITTPHSLLGGPGRISYWTRSHTRT